MRPSQLEAWVLTVADRVMAGSRIEDQRVELKAAFIDPVKAARQLAAHANASRGEPVLWVIGIDEKKGITGVKSPELADWLPQVRACFNGIAPEIMHLAVPYKDLELVALLADSTRAPFVVKNPDFGKSQTPISLEVPWREGASVRSATREDLLRLLLPVVPLPAFEWHFLRVNLTAGPNAPVRFGLQGHLYVLPQSDERVVIPFHQCAGYVRVPGLEPVAPIVSISVQPRFLRGVERRTLSHTLVASDTEVLISGPGQLNVNADAVLEHTMPDSVLSVDVVLELSPALSDSSVRLEVTAPIDPPNATSSDHWIFQAPRKALPN